jgi:hypothetical protein
LHAIKSLNSEVNMVQPNLYIKRTLFIWWLRSFTTKYSNEYDAKNKDWIQVQTFGNEIPSPRARFYSCQVNENLYVFLWRWRRSRKISQIIKCDNTIWKLHLPNMQWYKIGSFDASVLANETYSSFLANGKLYLIPTTSYSKTWVDFKQNTWKTFIENLIKPTPIYFDWTTKELVC